MNSNAERKPTEVAQEEYREIVQVTTGQLPSDKEQRKAKAVIELRGHQKQQEKLL